MAMNLDKPDKTKVLNLYAGIGGNRMGLPATPDDAQGLGETRPITSEVILGDCLEVMRQYPDNYFDLCLTDPPYGKKADKGTNGFGSSKNRKYDDNWDSFTPTKEYFDEIIRVSKHQIIFGGNYFTDKLPPSNSWIVWDKIGNHKFTNPFADCELAWTSFNKVVKKYTVIQQGFISADKERYHPTQKPRQLFKHIIADYTKESDLILDPFLGSGTTIRAAKDMGRSCVGIEINPKYVDIANDRERQEVLL